MLLRRPCLARGLTWKWFQRDADSLRALSAVAESLHKGLGAVEAALMSNDQGRAIILLEAPDVDEKGGA